MKIYFEEVSYTSLTSAAYVAPNALTNATLVYSGDIVLDTGFRPWNDVVLQTPFYLSPGKNLLVHIYDASGYTCSGTNSSNTAYYAFAHKTTSYNSAVYSRTAAGNGTFTTYGTHTRFALAGGTTDNALAISIENPYKTIAGQQNLVRVAIENNGFKILFLVRLMVGKWVLQHL